MTTVRLVGWSQNSRSIDELWDMCDYLTVAEFTDKDEPLDYCHGSIYLVLEYLEHDLTGLIDRQHPCVTLQAQ